MFVCDIIWTIAFIFSLRAMNKIEFCNVQPVPRIDCYHKMKVVNDTESTFINFLLMITRYNSQQ